ncbi:MAG TPA: cell wall hydrolase [Burkholderiales bacterium]|nr:cell wall hydrolase [Burkholderiales bacterium]
MRTVNARTRLADFSSRLYWAVAPARHRLRLLWYRADREAIGFALIVGAILSAFALVLQATFAYRDEVRERALQVSRQELTCLARNVYFEARGEPEAGQYAVAEVTMNRKASARYPESVCAVVYQKNWDALRGRFVGAFSWTELGALPEPRGEDWQRALKVAQDVYYGRRPLQLQGAMYYHATGITPAWAKEKKLVARIGAHAFYK